MFKEQEYSHEEWSILSKEPMLPLYEVFISVLARIAYKLIVSFNIERSCNIVIWQEARYEMSETEITTVKTATRQ